MYIHLIKDRVMFVLSRLICAMADNGLLLQGLGWIHAGTHSPIIAILASGTLAGEKAKPTPSLISSPHLDFFSGF